MTVDINNIVDLDYKRKPVRVQLGGEIIELPSRSAVLIERLIYTEERYRNAKSPVERAETLKECIGVIIGDHVNKVFPDAANADIDYMRSVYDTLINCLNKKTEEIINAEYL